jgi:hypothetical protein
MSNSEKPQYAAIEYPYPLDEIPIVHCPICGNATYKVDDGGSEMTPCHHLAFIFVGSSGTFEYKSAEFAERSSDVEEDDLSFENFEEYLESLEYDNSMLVLEVTHGGIPNVWYTDIYGFDYSTYQEK